MDAKVEALTEFNKTIPYDEMFDAAKEISGSKNITFEEPKLVKGRDSGSLYTTYRSNDIQRMMFIQYIYQMEFMILILNVIILEDNLEM